MEVCGEKNFLIDPFSLFLPPRNEIEEDKVKVQLYKIERCAERKQRERGKERERERGERGDDRVSESKRAGRLQQSSGGGGGSGGWRAAR